MLFFGEISTHCTLARCWTEYITRKVPCYGNGRANDTLKCSQKDVGQIGHHVADLNLGGETRVRGSYIQYNASLHCLSTLKMFGAVADAEEGGMQAALSHLHI